MTECTSLVLHLYFLSSRQQLILMMESRNNNKMTGSYAHKRSTAVDPLDPQISGSNGKSEIAEFYAGTNLFVTGGTGFIGRLLIEKLLRSCPGIMKIYALVRPKKGKSPKERCEETFAGVIFDRLRKEQPNFLSKIVIVEGDASEADFGLTPELKATLMDTNIIFHAAAIVRFDEKLHVGVNTNVRSTQCSLLWARQLPNLKAFVYVSTAFANSSNNIIEEKHYKPDIEADKLITLINCLNDDQLVAMEPILRGKKPNNYALTKAAAENAVLKYGDGLPVAIVRPSIVIATYEEPIRGWINNLYGATGVIAASTGGLLRTLPIKTQYNADVIPADYVIANIVAAAWDVGTRERVTNLEEGSVVSAEDKVPIYNSVSSVRNPITWYQYLSCSEVPPRIFPTLKAVWYLTIIASAYSYSYRIRSFFYHTIPATIGDTAARLIGQKPVLMDTYRKIHKFIDVLRYVTMQQWEFRDENVVKLWSKLNSVDRKLFNFNVENIDWDDYYEYQWRGIRLYLLNDPLDNLEQARAAYRKLRVIHYTSIAIFWLLVLGIAVFFVSYLWS